MLKLARAVLIVLFVASVLWAILFFLSLQGYNGYVRDYYEGCEQERQRILEEDGLHVSFWIAKAYWEWNNGGIILLFGFALLWAWIMAVLKGKCLLRNGKQ